MDREWEIEVETLTLVGTVTQKKWQDERMEALSIFEMYALQIYTQKLKLSLVSLAAMQQPVTPRAEILSGFVAVNGQSVDSTTP